MKILGGVAIFFRAAAGGAADLSGIVVGGYWRAMEVSNMLGPGLREKAYERALCLELAKRHVDFSQQRSFDVRYDGHLVDVLIPDLVVADCLIVDTKVVAGFDEAHEAQMMTCLAITGFRLAILLNFKHRKLSWKRIVR